MGEAANSYRLRTTGQARAGLRALAAAVLLPVVLSTAGCGPTTPHSGPTVKELKDLAKSCPTDKGLEMYVGVDASKSSQSDLLRAARSRELTDTATLVATCGG